MTDLDSNRDQPPADAGSPAAGWYPDPFGEHRLRFFDGTAWSRHVTHYGPDPCPGCAGS